MLDRDEIEEIRRSAPIEPVLIALGAQTWPGYNGKTKVTCPFHGDRRASAVIFADGATFYCSACDVKGDVFEIVQRGGLASSFPEAVEWVRENAVIPGWNTTDSS